VAPPASASPPDAIRSKQSVVCDCQVPMIGVRGEHQVNVECFATALMEQDTYD
jgi:hypothetical protein